MKLYIKLVFISLFTVSISFFWNVPLQEYPENGTIMLLGGGLSESHASLLLKLSKKQQPNIIVVPTAYSDSQIKRDSVFKKVHNRFKKIGIDSIHILHTRNRQVANSESFIKPLKSCDIIFFLGGKTSRIVDSYYQTKVHLELKNILKSGGVVAGVSAGSGVQANYFFNDSIKKGFGLLHDVIIMNHFFKKNKQFDYIEEIKKNRNYLSIGIDDNTAIVVNNGKFEVVGDSYVAIYDGKNYSRYNDSTSLLPDNSDKFYVLQDGDRYDLENREVISNGRLNSLMYSKKQLLEYRGEFASTSTAYRMECYVKNDTLFLKNSWGWKPYPIFPYKKDIFFARNRNMWFRFIRDPISKKIKGAQKMKSILQENIIVEMEKFD